jgi:hypothetical protein
MRNILIFLLVPVIVLLIFVVGGKWDNPNYGPGEWLTERFPSLQDGQGLEIGDVSTYEHLVEPVITVHIEDDLLTRCGKVANGCAIGNATECHIYVGERAKASTMAHEIRHCHGWAHGPKRINGHYQWYPKPHLVKP